MCNPRKALSQAWDDATGLVKGGLDAVGGIGQAAIDTVKTIAKNPLPVIEAVALTYVLGPEAGLTSLEATDAAILANAAVSAANGGKMEDIALAAGSAYLGGKIGQAAGANLPPEMSSVVKQVVTSASGAAAATALRGGNFNEILTSGFTTAVGSYVNASLKDSGLVNTDSKIVQNATSAAAGAILKGKSIADAVGSSIAATTIQLAIKDGVDTIAGNNTKILGLTKEFNTLYNAATNFYNESIDPVQTTAAENYKAATQAQTTYESVYAKQKSAYDNYVQAKDYYDNYDKRMVEIGYNLTDEDGRHYAIVGGHYQDMPDGEGGTYRAYVANPNDTVRTVYALTKDDYLANGNANAKLVNDYKKPVEEAYNKAVEAATTYSGNVTDLEKLKATYKTDYTSKLDAINTNIDAANDDQTKLAKTVGEDVIKYQDQLKTDAGDIAKQIAGETAKTAQNEVTAINEGFQSYSDKQAAGSDSAPNYYAKQDGYTDSSEKNAAVSGGFSDPATYRAADKIGFDNATDYRAAIKGGFEDANTYKAATEAGFSDKKTYSAATDAGFTDANTYSTATNQGFTDAKTYKEASAGGFDNPETFNDAK